MEATVARALSLGFADPALAAEVVEAQLVRESAHHTEWLRLARVVEQGEAVRAGYAPTDTPANRPEIAERGLLVDRGGIRAARRPDAVVAEAEASQALDAAITARILAAGITDPDPEGEDVGPDGAPAETTVDHIVSAVRDRLARAVTDAQAGGVAGGVAGGRARRNRGGQASLLDPPAAPTQRRPMRRPAPPEPTVEETEGIAQAAAWAIAAIAHSLGCSTVPAWLRDLAASAPHPVAMAAEEEAAAPEDDRLPAGPTAADLAAPATHAGRRAADLLALDQAEVDRWIVAATAGGRGAATAGAELGG